MGAQDSTQVPPPVEETPEQKLERVEKENDLLRQTLPGSPAAVADAVVESDAEKIRRLENERDAAKTTSQVPASGTSGGITDPSITLAGIEPGIKWGIRHGLIDAKQFGEHIVEMLEKGEI